MIDEKGAVAALKEAWRKGGYRFVYSNGILSVRAEGWGIQGALENVPAKVLGLIAEHFGSFPEDGDAFELKKGAAEQSVMYDQEATWWDAVRQLFDGEHADMRQTPLTLNYWEIWQEQRELRTALVDPARSRIIENNYRQQAAIVPGKTGTLLWKSMGGTMAYVQADPAADPAKTARLDGFPWCGE